MKTTPMIFNQEMVKALVTGNKTVTRRPVKEKYQSDIGYICGRLGNEEIVSLSYDSWLDDKGITRKPEFLVCSPEYESEGVLAIGQGIAKVGDLIWVRETFRLFDSSTECSCSESPCNCPSSGSPIYRAMGCDTGEETWKPSIHMPRWASRLTLRVTDLRVERVQDIGEEEAKQEGVSPMFVDDIGKVFHQPYYKNGFYHIWNSIYSNWDENPWVWVIEFEVIHKNVDQVLAEVAV